MACKLSALQWHRLGGHTWKTSYAEGETGSGGLLVLALSQEQSSSATTELSVHQGWGYLRWLPLLAADWRALDVCPG